MATTSQREAAKKNLEQAREKWQTITHRAKPGAKGGGDYFRIVVRPEDEFRTFRYHDIGKPGHVQRLAGRKSGGGWSTQAWLISKHDAHLEGKTLVPDTSDAREVINALGSEPTQVKADIFLAKDKPGSI